MDLKLVIFLFHFFLIDVIVVSTDTESKNTATCGSPGIPGVPGVPGNPRGIGAPGSPGSEGAKGEPGVPGNCRGSGATGKVGAKGEPGAKGEQGAAGYPGKSGRPGSVGKKGEPGAPGNPGSKGIPGLHGPAGVKGEPGERIQSNWKQCVWKRVDGKDTGLIQNCIFQKNNDNTSLRVFYGGSLYSDGGDSCNRWYFTFGGKECTNPGTIEGLVYYELRTDPHRHGHIEGYCNQVPKGQVRVGFWIGKCERFSSVGDGYTGWRSNSRIVIEEVPPPQT